MKKAKKKAKSASVIDIRRNSPMPAACLTKCPVNGCAERPVPIMCMTHWPLVSGNVRRRLILEFKTLRGRGVGSPPAGLLELLYEAVKEATKEAVA
jgi:hypothetical protein